MMRKPTLRTAPDSVKMWERTLCEGPVLAIHRSTGGVACSLYLVKRRLRAKAGL